MLRTPTDFPYVGSTAFVSPNADQVRILQHNANGTVLVAFVRHPADRSASDTRTVDRNEIFASVEAALGKRPRRRKAA
ncbi:hypothetical protein Saro_0631 [Novosphingobium aromaticivorans DSM 12444]|uniref:Uncharacterized protein n=1 Tax=Novosphingobium aromaticivorans (strain ATCC 700278 / DSM 12444 / CCUG 56034 / CIP 105152 / NBRC 16084 / F199) TaxID=279238 RepID=Q2GAP5_NOVAD|nr:hypothetical protein [Novosphingobium aromaticivorans]ABD25078.1 hypothetical protein Saro_0631 [Novosphingobium aromaticivorans DSM 12444]SCY96113.1 hypothetical protein SAMN05660666_03903 [Novosphingobium aromaticivorans]